MAPPCYADLGRQARDIFNKSYNFNLVKLDCKTKTTGGVEFNVSQSSSSETGKITASLESKYKIPDYGIVLKEKWTTDNILSTDISVEDKPVKGMKTTLDAMFVPQTGKKGAVVKQSFKTDYFHLNTEVDLCVAPIVKFGTVIGIDGWLGGAQGAFDTSKNILRKSNFALGYAVNDFVLHTFVNDGQKFGGSVYQKVNKNLEVGIQFGWSADKNSTTFGLGSVYSIDKDTSLRCKINNTSEIGMGICHKLRPGIILTISAMVDGKNFNQGGHKLGIGLELEA